tara:strand:- start:247 stop:546 length:300 start_codon:yes stop_codon:yes gene_type:complete
MALTKTITDDLITIVGDYKHLEIRSATVIKEDGVELSRTFHRKTIIPGDLDKDNNLIDTDLSKESAEIRGIAAAVWTDAVKNSWKNALVSNLPEGFDPK